MQSINQVLQQFNIPIKEILIEKNLVEKADDLMNKIGFGNKKILLVTDQNIYPIAQKIIDLLSCQSLILQTPKADQKTVLEITNNAANYDLIIAVGSGVINDLCKAASFNLKIPYIIFGTAPSMNGYASANASITIENHKTSIAAHLPAAIYLDLNVLTKSPLRLIKSGIGDSLCFSTCQFDWLLSHLLLNTYYNQTPFDLLKPHHTKLLTYDLRLTTYDFIKILSKILIISGLGMYICKGSYPASQAEHLIAHYIEILYPKIAIKSYHGEQIAVCTLSVVDIQAKILEQQNLQIKPTNFEQKYLNETFGKELGNHFFEEIGKKTIDENLAQKINQNLQRNWQEIRSELRKTFITKNDLLKSYQQFSLPQNSEEIDWSQKIYDEAINNAHLIRNRFTSLDLIKTIM